MHNSRHYLDEKLRKQMMEPEQILAEVGLTAGMTLADLGCGEGYFAVPAAVIAGPAGRIYAVDTNQSAVDKLSRRAKLKGLPI
jgi:precorrin-6B methylase 2